MYRHVLTLTMTVTDMKIVKLQATSQFEEDSLPPTMFTRERVTGNIPITIIIIVFAIKLIKKQSYFFSIMMLYFFSVKLTFSRANSLLLASVAAP